MPFELPLPALLYQQGWKVKIQDKERLEEPHVTIIFKTKRWRVGLRTLGFLDRSPDPKEVPEGVLKAIRGNAMRLCQEWDAMYPVNPV
jgi:hypothetical protein